MKSIPTIHTWPENTAGRTIARPWRQGKSVVKSDTGMYARIKTGLTSVKRMASFRMQNMTPHNKQSTWKTLLKFGTSELLSRENLIMRKKKRIDRDLDLIRIYLQIWQGGNIEWPFWYSRTHFRALERVGDDSTLLARTHEDIVNFLSESTGRRFRNYAGRVEGIHADGFTQLTLRHTKRQWFNWNWFHENGQGS